VGFMTIFSKGDTGRPNTPQRGRADAGRIVLHPNTPSRVNAFAAQVQTIVQTLPVSASLGKRDVINLLPGCVEPGDAVEIQRLATLMGIRTLLFPDGSGILDFAMTGNGSWVWTGWDGLRAAGGNCATLALGPMASAASARALDERCQVPCQVLELPIGLAATDLVVDSLSRLAGVPVPEILRRERAQLKGFMTDMAPYTTGRKVALCGDADHLVGLAGFLMELGMLPIHIVSGAQGRRTTVRLRQVLAPLRHPINMKVPGDPAQLGPWIRQEPVDLLMGGASCAELARSEGMALLRFGFSGADPARYPGAQHLGYRGGLRLLEQILDGLMPGQAWTSPEGLIRQVM